MRVSLFSNVGVVVGLILVSVASADAQPSPQRLAALAREARTGPQHAVLAREYRVQAETFERKAGEIEGRVERLQRSLPAIAHKWPAMAPRELTSAKEEAVSARRAARESRLLADRHLRLAVEAAAQ